MKEWDDHCDDELMIKIGCKRGESLAHKNFEGWTKIVEALQA
jgi:hypothetical protein